MALIDQFGNPIPRAAMAGLGKETAGPSAFSARPPFEGHLAYGMAPERLGVILRAADSGNTHDWMILAEEIEELFPHYASVLGKRRRQVVQLPMTVEEAPDVKDGRKHADFVREWLATGALERAMFDITDAIGKGYSASEIVWETAPGRVRPLEILYRPPRFFELSWEDGETLWLRTAAGFADLAAHKWLLHVHRSKSGGPARSGVTRAVAFLWLYSAYTLKDWALFTQAYGLPVRVGTYGPAASESDKRVLWQAVSQIAGDLAAIIPESMKIEFVEAKAREGHTLYSDRGNWLNYEVSKLVLGSTAATDAIHGGHAVGQEHRAVEQDVERFDARLLQTSVTRQLVQPMIAFTFGPQSAYPRIVIGRPEQVPMSDVIAAVADLGPLGFKAKAEEIRDRLQLTKPEGDDEVIGVPTPVPGLPGATPGAGGGAGAGDAANPLAKSDVKIKPNPHPEINPASDLRAIEGMRGLLSRFATREAAGAGPIFDALDARLAREAAGALAGMTEEVRRAVEGARDLPELADKLAALRLDDKAFGEAMARGMVLAHLAGQAALMDELAPHRR
ncbi:MAG: DUF935 family protein [Rhodospirillales bacterium]|nr:DUF935 family protein [Rhodospirillales bacterium]